MTNLPKLTQEEFERRVKRIEKMRDKKWAKSIDAWDMGAAFWLNKALQVLTRKPRRKK